MTTLLITLIPIAAAIGYFTCAILAAGTRADSEAQIQRLRWHLTKMLHEYDNHESITFDTLQNARKTLNES